MTTRVGLFRSASSKLKGALPYLEKSPVLTCPVFFIIEIIIILLQRGLSKTPADNAPTEGLLSCGSFLRSFVKGQSGRTTSTSQNILGIMQISHRRIATVFIFSTGPREESTARANRCGRVCECVRVGRIAAAHLHCRVDHRVIR